MRRPAGRLVVGQHHALPVVAGFERERPDLFGGQKDDARDAGRTVATQSVVVGGVLDRPPDDLAEGGCPVRLVDDAEFGVRVTKDTRVAGVELEGERRRDEAVRLAVSLEPLEILLAEGQGEAHATTYVRAGDLDAECGTAIHFAFLSLRLSYVVSVETLGTTF